MNTLLIDILIRSAAFVITSLMYLEIDKKKSVGDVVEMGEQARNE